MTEKKGGSDVGRWTLNMSGYRGDEIYEFIGN